MYSYESSDYFESYKINLKANSREEYDKVMSKLHVECSYAFAEQR